MESLAPPVRLLLSIKRSIEMGESVRQGLKHYLSSTQDDFAPHVSLWLSLLQQGKETHQCLLKIQSPARRILLQILERGLKGESIYAALESLEEELILSCQREIDEKIAKLPLLMLIPLLLLQFPAFLMLLFGPLLKIFFHSLGGG